MPLSDIHKKKRMKNLAILAAIIAWCAIIFTVAMIKMK
jgi:hypothetical protein